MSAPTGLWHLKKLYITKIFCRYLAGEHGSPLHATKNIGFDFKKSTTKYLDRNK